jgi:OHCU decarboxylase
LTDPDYFDTTLGRINDSPSDIAYQQLMLCCGSTEWARKMTIARPFSSVAQLEQAADRIWTGCARKDWIEAFAAHSKIGEGSLSNWSRQEQSGVFNAPPEILAAFLEASREYEAKFGYTFIVCAAGKTLAEMLAILLGRLRMTPRAEIRNAAEEQRLITRVRLRKLLGG